MDGQVIGADCQPIITSYEDIKKKDKFYIYPNPLTKGQAFYINSTTFSKEKPLDISVYNAKGQLVEEFLKHPEGKGFILNEAYWEGVYFVKIKTANGQVNYLKLMINNF